MELIETSLADAWLLKPRVFSDHRGDFVKTFHEVVFRDLGLEFVPREEFFSTSRKGVLRGMHFQLPPADHAKLVYCIQGTMLDVIVDIRKSSVTYGQFASFKLSEENRQMAFIPSGFAHGFLSLSENSVMVYKTSSVHAPELDAGIRWDSFGFEWPEDHPLLSDRDRAFPTLSEFDPSF